MWIYNVSFINDLHFSFKGINVHAEDLIRDPSHIPFVKDRNMVLFCWGEDINHSAVIRSLKDQGVDGVIYDKWVFFYFYFI